MKERRIFGSTEETKTVKIQLRYTKTDEEISVLNICCETGDGFTEEDVRAIIDYFQSFLRNKTESSK